MGSTEPAVLPEQREETVTRQMPYYHVILLNDDDHTFEYVIGMLKDIFGHPESRGYLMAIKVHLEGRVIVDTTTLERAELKQDQIHSYGPDPLLERCAGSMSAIIEPAE